MSFCCVFSPGNIPKKIHGQISGGRTHTHTPFGNGLAGVHRTRVQNFRIYLPKTAGTSDSLINLGRSPRTSSCLCCCPGGFEVTASRSEGSALHLLYRTWNCYGRGALGGSRHLVLFRDAGDVSSSGFVHMEWPTEYDIALIE